MLGNIRRSHLAFLFVILGAGSLILQTVPLYGRGPPEPAIVSKITDTGKVAQELPTVRQSRPNTATSLSPEAEQVIRSQRDAMAQELSDYRFKNSTLQGLLFDSGGSPLRSLVVTTWRSGSTFLADVLNSHPAMYYHYEPLMDFGIRRARDPPLFDKAVSNLHNLMSCDYSRMGEYISFSRSHLYVFLHNFRLWRYCRNGRWPSCWQPDFLSSFCRLFPFQTTKTVRLPLAGAEPLLAGQPGLRVLLLVRDPRGTLQSRRHRTWCPGQPDCSDPARLCGDLEDDFWAAQRLGNTYGTDRLRVVRYEDFSVQVATSVPILMKFVGLQYHPMVQQFVKTHTTLSKGGVSSTFRNSTTAPFKWVQSLSWPEVDRIQNKCANAMRLWGYKTLTKDDWETANRDKAQPLKPGMFFDDLHLGNMLWTV